MKKYILLLLTLTLALQSCDKERLGVISSSNADDNREIHFTQSKLSKEFAQGTEEGVITVILGRQGNQGTYRVVLEKSGQNANLFSVADTVVIPDGKYTVEVPVKVNMTSVVLGSEVSARLRISGRDIQLGDNPAYLSQYSDFIKLSASYTLEWEPLMRTNEEGEQIQQLASFIYTQFYEGYQSGMLVEKAKGTDNIYRLMDWAAGVPFLFKVESKNKVVVPAQSTGFYMEELGEYVQVSDVATYLKSESMYSSYPCTFDGKQTYTLNLIYYVTDGIYAYGEEKVIFASDSDDDPIVELNYKGDGVFSFDFNPFTEYCKAVVVEGNITENSELIDQIYKTMSLNNKFDQTKAVDISKLQEQIKIINASGEVSWTPTTASNTILVLPYDADNKPGELIVMRFTYDPEALYTPKIIKSVLAANELNPYTALEWNLQVSNVSALKYVFIETDVLSYFQGSYSNDLIFERLGVNLDSETLQLASKDDGVKLYFQNLKEGVDYSLFLLASNALGDTLTHKTNVKLKSHSDSYLKKSIDDFVGSYIVNAFVTTSDDTKGTNESFRVDIIKTGENTVSVKGLSNYKNYSPAISGSYDEGNSTIRLDSQNLGEFSYMTVVFGFVTELYTGIWGTNSSIEFGFAENGLLYWRATENSEMPVNGYKFLLFDGNSYSGYAVADKTYTDIVMRKIN